MNVNKGEQKPNQRAVIMNTGVQEVGGATYCKAIVTYLPMATTWVNLLRKNGLDTPARSSAARQSSRVGLGRGVTVSEKTPQAKVGTKKSTTRSKEGSSVQVLRSQIADLLREKRQLADKVCDRAGVPVPQCMWRGCTCEESVKCEEN